VRNRISEGVHRIGVVLAVPLLLASIAAGGYGASWGWQLWSTKAVVEQRVHNLRLLVDAEQRGILQDEKRALLEEIRRRANRVAPATSSGVSHDLIEDWLRREQTIARGEVHFWAFVAGLFSALAFVLYVASRAIGWIVNGFAGR